MYSNWTMGWWSFWSWSDVNLPTFDESMSRKRFSHFRSQWPWPLTFRPQICSLVQRHDYTKLEVSTSFLLRENQRLRTDGQTDGVQRIMRPPYGGPYKNINLLKHCRGHCRQAASVKARTNSLEIAGWWSRCWLWTCLSRTWKHANSSHITER